VSRRGSVCQIGKKAGAQNRASIKSDVSSGNGWSGQAKCVRKQVAECHLGGGWPAHRIRPGATASPRLVQSAAFPTPRHYGWKPGLG